MKGEEVLVKYQDGESFGVHDAARDVLEACGVHGAPLLKVVRQKCLDCSAGQISEVRKCTCWNTCPLWPYRMGKNPFSNHKGNASALTAEKSDCVGG
jgi:hypothetical protein